MYMVIFGKQERNVIRRSCIHVLASQQMAEEEGFFSFMECMMARENVLLEKGYGLMD